MRARVTAISEDSLRVQGAKVSMSLIGSTLGQSGLTDSNGEWVTLMLSYENKGWIPVRFLVEPPAGSALRSGEVADSVYFYSVINFDPPEQQYRMVLRR